MQAKGRYTILGEIASGGTATVFLAEDSVLRRKVALKKLHPHLLNHPEMVRRFEKEAVAVASLSHGNVIKVYDYGREDKGLFLAMEYVDGFSLDRLLQDSSTGIPNLTALTIFHQLLEGLAAAHACGICHRDIKPSNVLVDKKGCVRIADFGIAFLAEETSITKTGSYLGTPGYSAPEQALGKAVTFKTDVFASGTLFYRALTGKMPFEAETPHAVLMAIMERIPAKASQVNRRILPGLADLVQDMLAKEPERRPAAAECAQRLEAIAEGMGFSLDPARICRLLAGPAQALAAECAEISLNYARVARASNGNGAVRDAIKSYSLAEAFAEPGSEIRVEAARFLSRRVAIARRRKGVLVALTLMIAVFGGTFAIRTFLAMPAEKPGARPVPESAAPASAAQRPQSPTPPSFTGGPQATVTPELPAPTVSAVAEAPAAQPAATRPVAGTAEKFGSAGFPETNEMGTHRPLVHSAHSKPAAPGAKTKPHHLIASAAIPIAKPRAADAAGGSFPAASHSPASSAPAAAESHGLLWVKTNPPFAKIYVDGREMGSTPLGEPLKVSAGTHRLELERVGCKTTRTEFTIVDAQTASLRFTLDRIEGAP